MQRYVRVEDERSEDDQQRVSERSYVARRGAERNTGTRRADRGR
jgi:hypothetical protein